MKERDSRKENAIVFIGLIRSRELFHRSLEPCFELRKRGIVREIVASLWREEVDEKPDLADFLERNGVMIVTHPRPTDHPVFEKLGRHGIKQMRFFREGIKALPENRRVLRTRFDVIFSPQRLEEILTADLGKGPGEAGRKSRLSGRLWTPATWLTQPLGFRDWCYFGWRSDLERMAFLNENDYLHLYRRHLESGRYDKEENMLSLGTGFWQFLGGFRDDFPLFDLFSDLRVFTDKRRPFYRELMPVLLEDPGYLSLLALYFAVLSDLVIVGDIEGIHYYPGSGRSLYPGGKPRTWFRPKSHRLYAIEEGFESAVRREGYTAWLFNNEFAGRFAGGDLKDATEKKIRSLQHRAVKMDREEALSCLESTRDAIREKSAGFPSPEYRDRKAGIPESV